MTTGERTVRRGETWSPGWMAMSSLCCWNKWTAWDEGKAVANRVNEALRKGFQIDGNEVILSASIGIVSSHGETTEAAEILRARPTLH